MNQIVKFVTVCAGYGGTRLNSGALEGTVQELEASLDYVRLCLKHLSTKINKQKLKGEEKENLT